MSFAILYSLVLAIGIVLTIGQMIKKDYKILYCILGVFLFGSALQQLITHFGYSAATANIIAAIGIVYAIGYFFYEKRFNGFWTVIGILAFSSMLTPAISFAGG